MLEPGTGPVFLMAYSFADVFRVYKNNLKLAVCHCGWVRSLGSQTHSLCVNLALLGVTLGKRHHHSKSISSFAKDNSSAHHTGSCENEVGGEMEAPQQSAGWVANAQKCQLILEWSFQTVFFNCHFGFRDLIVEWGQQSAHCPMGGIVSPFKAGR